MLLDRWSVQFREAKVGHRLDLIERIIFMIARECYRVGGRSGSHAEPEVDKDRTEIEVGSWSQGFKE